MRSVSLIQSDSDTGMREPIVSNDESIPDLSAEGVLVQVKASVLSVPDFQVLQELGISQQRIPIGREISGIVKEVGANVTRFKQGEEVVGILPLDANCSGCAEFCPVNEHDLVVKPKDVKFSDAAAVVGDAVNSYTALHYLGRICAGETILVTGIKGAGSIAIQLASQWGAKVIAIASTEDERSHLESLRSKVSHVIEIGGQNKFAILNECLEETGGLGVDCVLDSGVNMFPNDFKEEGLNPVKTSPLPSKHEIISCLAVGGRWITAQSDLQLDPPDSKLLFLKGASLHFLNPDVWTLSSSQQGRYLHILQDTMEKLAGGHIRPTISQRIALDQIPIWYQRTREKSIGKVVVEL
ncbi:quinone oxidoreductase-like protein 1 [Apostichopus japonicus]|uniref:quinone oxidoreductase-like protein 1 n=1 Tax=Stichopus japonicus TaxID=307972 RepID=UPI003AB8FCBE